MVDCKAGGLCTLDVLKAVRDGIAELENTVGASFLHMVARDGNGVELGHVLGRIGDDVADDPHRRARRVDIGITDHKLLRQRRRKCGLIISHFEERREGAKGGGGY